jgi:ATP-dependent helicase HrpB
VEVGEGIGLQMKGIRKITRDGPDRTFLLSMTAGSLVARMAHDKDLDSVAFVVFDEVHERGIETDAAIGRVMQVSTAVVVLMAAHAAPS